MIERNKEFNADNVGSIYVSGEVKCALSHHTYVAGKDPHLLVAAMRVAIASTDMYFLRGWTTVYIFQSWGVKTVMFRGRGGSWIGYSMILTSFDVQMCGTYVRLKPLPPICTLIFHVGVQNIYATQGQVSTQGSGSKIKKKEL